MKHAFKGHRHSAFPGTGQASKPKRCPPMSKKASTLIPRHLSLVPVNIRCFLLCHVLLQISGAILGDIIYK
jgi:hypothetical protein